MSKGLTDRQLQGTPGAIAVLHTQFRRLDDLEKRSIAGADFLWLVLQHVLPRGFRRAHNYGFLHANRKRLIALLHLLSKFDPGRFMPPPKVRPPMRCACCGVVMAIVRTRIRSTSAGASATPPVVGPEI